MTTLLLFLTTVPAPAAPAANLVVNGSFDHPDDPLHGWKSVYDQPGESWYFDNHKYVSVLPSESGRRSVLRLHVATQFLADFPGVKVDSQPIPIKPHGQFRLSAAARTNGPGLRFLLEGYKWKPGVTPHPQPKLEELRKCYRFSLLYFGDLKAGKTSNVTPTWRTATMTFPRHDGKELQELQQKLFDDVTFLVIHIVGITGQLGEVFIDDVVLEEIGR